MAWQGAQLTRKPKSKHQDQSACQLVSLPHLKLDEEAVDPDEYGDG
jgi:hypothetical protein